MGNELNLKPCPLCGNNAEIIPVRATEPKVVVIRCKSRCCATKGYCSQSEAIDAWNRRVKYD